MTCWASTVDGCPRRYLAAVFCVSFGLLAYIGVLSLGAQPEVKRVSDDF